jgi:hypothetical protein
MFVNDLSIGSDFLFSPGIIRRGLLFGLYVLSIQAHGKGAEANKQESHDDQPECIGQAVLEEIAGIAHEGNDAGEQKCAAANNGAEIVHLHRKSHQKQYEFALGIDPVSDRKTAVISISVLIFYGLKLDTTTGLNLGSNQHHGVLFNNWPA